ncbi:transposase [Actinacidiphila glaucinigra]|uniref:transposase n=1 Tax=Actinacidiphila glaucinigra TaxID=235986 RepID=UPI002E2EBFE6|nr:transposase [Actinacidiphila glaucinigra]
MKNYPPQFKADAVALYQSRPEATIRQVAADLGINRHEAGPITQRRSRTRHADRVGTTG